MNITHATKEVIEGDMLKAIFTRQKELMEKYHHIESESGLCQTDDCPVNLDDRRGQARIKDFSWRVTEELGEAIDAFVFDYPDHFKEELVDGLHFLTELSILSGITPDDFFNDTKGNDSLELIWKAAKGQATTLDKAVTNFIWTLGMTCNCLKNKPWKQSSMLTDTDVFFTRLFSVWYSYFTILVFAFEDAEEVAMVYLQKSQVNKFRQRSGY